MKPGLYYVPLWLLLVSLLLSACGEGQFASQTVSPSKTSSSPPAPISTQTYTPTHLPYPTSTITSTFTPSPIPSATPIPTKVSVSNLSDIVDGNTVDFYSLINNPGSDGISFREALLAANGTTGLKLITFHPGLVGATIIITADRDPLLLASGDLTIDGDINQDGMPEITIDQLPSPAFGLNIVSSNNTITGLNLVNFEVAIRISCSDVGCGTKLFSNNKIINNHITSKQGSGISIAPLGLLSAQDAPLLSDITWQDTVISGNTFATGESAIYIAPANAGGDRNRIINLVISGNHILSQAAVVVGIMMADVNSAYFDLPGPVDYSDDNLIENITINDNVIEAPNGFGIYIDGANEGNSNNQLQNLMIKNNNLSSVKYTAISLTSADYGGIDRGSNNNHISNVEIIQNTISQTWSGISITAAGTGTQPGGSNNSVENVLITDNVISDFTGMGIFLFGGDSTSKEISDNILAQITISGNNIQQIISPGAGTGIDIRGGTSSGGLVSRNIIQGIHILNNQIRQSYTGIRIVGGDGTGSNENKVTIEEMGGNILADNTKEEEIQDNVNGASGNKVIILKKY